MRNKYILLLVLITALTFALGIVSSCKKNQDSESDSSNQNESVTDYVLTLDKNVTVYEYESAVINYTVQGTVENPQWRSADTTIAMVSEGVVYGVKAGVTTITAKIGEIEETCEVKVEKTIYAPTIKFAEEIVIENGDVYKSEVVTIWNGQKAENDYYTWTLADGMANDICSIESDGNKVAITALKKGETAYYVSTTFRGVYVNRKVSIKVIKSTATIVPVNNEIEPEKDGFGVTLYTSEIGGETEKEISFIAMENGEIKNNVKVVWNFDMADYDDNIASFSETSEGIYKITKVSEGRTLIEGEYQTFEGDKITVKLYINVIKAVSVIDFKPVIEVSRLGEIRIPEGIDSEIKGFLVAGSDAFAGTTNSSIKLEKDKLPKTAKKLGKNVECVIVTDDVNYTFSSDVYSLIIKTAADVNSFGGIAKENGNFGKDGSAILDGYFVLANDIEYNGEYETPTDTNEVATALKTGNGGYLWNNTAVSGFKGVFDGNGYNIHGLTVVSKKTGAPSGGFIGYLNDEGIFRNISFTDAIVTENNGYVCAVGGGLIENVSITYKKLGVGNETVNLDTYPRKMGSFFSYLNTSNATVRNCFVDVTCAEILYKVGTGGSSNLTIGTRADKVENFIIVGGNATYATEYGTKTYAFDYDALAASEDCRKAMNAMGNAWEIINGKPILKKGNV